MASRTLTATDLWTIPRVGAPEPSPDGKQILVTVTTHNLEQNQGKSRLWLLPSDALHAGMERKGDAARPLTGNEQSSNQPAWAPDGRRILFVRKPGGTAGRGETSSKTHPKGAGLSTAFPDQPQLYLLSLDGGEPERLTDFPFGIAAPRFFPDGRRVAFLAPVYSDAPKLKATAEQARQRAKDPVKARTTEDRFYRIWDQWLTEGKVHHIFILDLETGDVRDLTPNSRRWFDWMDLSGQFQISPDGKEIAFAASRSTPPHDPVQWGVFTVKVPSSMTKSAKAGRTKSLTPRFAADAVHPVYSPDGRWILFGFQREYDFYADRVRLIAHDRSTGRQTVLTEDWDCSAIGWTFGNDSRTVYLEAEVAARMAIFSFNFQAALKDPQSTKPWELVRGGSFSPPRPAGKRLYTNVSTLSAPPEIVSFDLQGRAERRHTAFTKPIMNGIRLGKVEEFIFAGAEEHPVQMFLIHPPETVKIEKVTKKPARAKRLPLVHVIHGGPHGTSSDSWHWRWNGQVFAAPGYLVAMVNFHGSTSWGQGFTSSILGRWGDQPYKDIMAATDELISRGLADPKRMAATGGAYGGYLVSWIASQTDRFACLINHAGVCDFQTQYASDITQGRRRSMGGEVWNNQEGLDRYNPMRQAAGFKSPMLIIHGEQDYRVPYVQGIQIYNVYKAMKLPARLVCYPDENHWILKPRNSIFWYDEFLSWLKRWIGRKNP
ncbi:MAG: S9 family peptidase [Candidatus Eisenbacteria bacterium]|nr:S9 family peptidase [Candidatus Eisenbacteria bacterium]